MNLFDQITWKSSLNSFLWKTPEQPSFAIPAQAPRTENYVAPTPIKKQSSPVKHTPTATEWAIFKWIQWAANMFTWAKENLQWAEEQDKVKFEQDIEAKKQIFTQKKLKEWYSPGQIDGALKILEEKWEFTYKPWFGTRLSKNIGNRMQELQNTTERTANQKWDYASLSAPLAYAWDITWWVIWDVIGATVEPYIAPVVQKIVEMTGQKDNIVELGKGWEEFKATNPNLADSIEWALNVASVGLPSTKTWQSVIKAPATLAKDIVVWATELTWKTVNKVKSFFPTPEQKLVKDLWQETAPWFVAWKKVEVPVPKKGIIERATFWLWRETDPKVLAWRALTPTYAGKTPKQILSTVWDLEANVKKLYEGIRTWVYKWDVSTLENAANSVVQNLDDIGWRIWASVKEAQGKIPLSKNRAEIKKVLSDPIEKRGWAYQILKNFYQDTAPIDWLSIQRAFKAKKIYQAEIKKLIKSWDTGTDAYESLIKWVQELNDSIDNAVANTPWFKEWKGQYAHLKKLVTDMAKSAAVEWRRSPQTFVEQLWMVETLMDAVSNPLSTAWKLYAKEIGELNTRGWAWKELMKIYDTEAIASKWAKVKTPVRKPVKITK